MKDTVKVPWKAYILNAFCTVLIFVALSGMIEAKVIDKYIQGIIMLVFVNIFLAVSLNLTTGFLGQIALGHAGFMSIGAYTSAIITKAVKDLPDGSFLQSLPPQLIFGVALLAGGILAALFGILVGIPALRLKGDYLAIITLGFGEIIRVIMENLEITGGAQGLRSIPGYSTKYFGMCYWITILSIVILYMLVRSRHGRAIMAIREDDIASEAVGIPNTYYKVMAFSVAAFFAGIAGGIYAHYLRILGAKSFNFSRSIEIIVIVVLGGMGSMTGSIVAAIALTILPEALRSFSDYRMLAYSIALIVVMIFKPSGLFGRYEFSLMGCIDKILGKGKKRSKETAAEGSVK